MNIERLSAPLGAVIRNLDVRAITSAEGLELERLFNTHKVLVFREQSLTPEDQLAFGARWGRLIRHPYAGRADYPEIIELTNRGKAKDVNQHWHSDMTYNVAPPKLTMLYALDVPGIGGDTAFANQVLAFEALSLGLRNALLALRAVHSASGLARIYGEDPKKAPRAEHPVVRTHDVTGERALFVCRAFTERFVGWSREESAPLLDYLFQHGTRPEFQARQQWRRGDLVMWDNRSLLHFAVHDHGDEPRVIHRLQVEGDVPR
jgi:taurine dioxygenase